MKFCDPKTCLHLHLICTECDFENGYCHCNDGGDWFCQDCNSMDFETYNDCLVNIDDVVELRNPVTHYLHQRKIMITKTTKGDS